MRTRRAGYLRRESIPLSLTSPQGEKDREPFDEGPDLVRAALAEQVRPYVNPAMTIDELLDVLGLPDFASAVRSS